MKYLIGIALMVSLCSGAFAAAETDEAVLTALLNEFLAGASVNDAAAHNRFWSEQLVYTSSGGERFGKAEIMDGLKADSGTDTDEPAVNWSAQDIRIQQWDDTAVVAFRLVGAVQDRTGAVTEYFNTGTFRKSGGQWRAVAWQATRIPAQD